MKDTKRQKLKWKWIPVLLVLTGIHSGMRAQDTQMSTYCNPLNIDYTYMIYNAHNDLSYRSGADPAVVEFRGEYYMFVTRSMGYWHSPDLLNWRFIEPQQWYFQGSNAPAAFNYKDSLLYIAGDPSGSMSILYSDDPRSGRWEATPAILNNLQDPALFIDDDGQAYIFWGSSNTFPIRARKLDRSKSFRPDEKIHELFNLDMDKHGWERFGENHGDTVLGGYIEGPWMTKRNGTYYLQYAAPGTQFNVYGDGIYTSHSPLGPYTYAPNNPAIYKPGGYANGAGHGSIVIGPRGNYWHFGSMAVAVNVGWERRIVMYPVQFDSDGLLHANTSFGDYPHYAPAVAGKAGTHTGWMLLSYNKPVKASSHVSDHHPGNVVDENVKTFWLAEIKKDASSKKEQKGDSSKSFISAAPQPGSSSTGARSPEEPWLEIDLVHPGTVFAVQVNYHDHESGLYGRVPGLFHRYVIEGSADGTQWELLVDRSDSYRDTPNDYVELGTPCTVRYLRYRSFHVPTPHLALSALRVFGLGSGKPPKAVKKLNVERYDDRRDGLVTWEKQDNCQGYNVLWGIAPDKLYSSWLVYGRNKLELKSLTTDREYYFAVEAFNENGISERSEVIRIR